MYALGCHAMLEYVMNLVPSILYYFARVNVSISSLSHADPGADEFLATDNYVY